MIRQRTLGPDPVRARADACCAAMTTAQAAAHLKLIAPRAAALTGPPEHPQPAEGLCPCGAGVGRYGRLAWSARTRGAQEPCPTCRPSSGDVIDLVMACTAGGFDQACAWIEQTVANTRCGGTQDMFGGR